MPRAIQTVAGFATGGAAGTFTVTPSPPDVTAVASFATTARASIGQISAAGASLDFVRVRSARLHDANQGLRLYAGATKYRSLLPWELYEPVYPADTPTIEVDLTAASTGGVLVTYEYDDLPGAQPQLANWSEVSSRIVHTMGCEVDVTSSATIGSWGASQPINANFDNFEAGATYALLGYTCSTACLGIRITGKDTGNLGIGFPGDPDPVYAKYYFIDAAERSSAPYIPLIQANNKSSTYLQNVDVAASTATKVTLLLAQLA